MFTAFSVPFFTFFYENETNKVLKVTYRRQLNFTKVQSHLIQRRHEKGMFLFMTRRIDASFGMNLHFLEQEIQSYVSSFYFFSYFLQNNDRNYVNISHHFPHQHHNVTNQTKEFSSFAQEICHVGFSFGRIRDCLRTFLSIAPTKKRNMQKSTFTCDNNVKIDLLLVDDLAADCPQSEDEPTLHTQIVEKKSFKCKLQHQIPCRSGHVKCYNISEICSYKLNKKNHLIPCRTGEHLQSCEHFTCNVMFKCAFYYCILWAYVCDQK